jgi:hypothetical protein
MCECVKRLFRWLDRVTTIGIPKPQFDFFGIGILIRPGCPAWVADTPSFSDSLVAIAQSVASETGKAWGDLNGLLIDFEPEPIVRGGFKMDGVVVNLKWIKVATQDTVRGWHPKNLRETALAHELRHVLTGKMEG